MIASLHGVVSEKLADSIIVECAGVGYGAYVTHEDFGRLTTGQTIRLYVYEHIREQQHDLFGFIQTDTKALFELLLTVNGVGPKMALNMLSVATGNEVRAAIATGDVKLLQAAPGVGKRVAERVVVDLKDKVGLEGVDLQATGLLQGEAGLMQDEAVAALVALGYSAPDAVKALAGVDESLSTEDRIRHALRSK